LCNTPSYASKAFDEAIRRGYSLLFPVFAAAKPVEVAPGVFRIQDTVNVYAVVRNHKALLIDFGSGRALDELKTIGGPKPEWILHTHFHRDRSQGDPLAKSRGIKIAVPDAERRYFDDVEKMWQEKKIFMLYDMRNEFFALRENVPVDRGPKPNEEFNWEGITLRAIATPGHTQGQLSYLVDIEDKKILFCGDTVSAPGKIPTLHDLEWPYLGSPDFLPRCVPLVRSARSRPACSFLPMASQSVSHWTGFPRSSRKSPA
jgi:glyoxylase-like metal-dependent hydrolase (beta-lactamase superfamily II)